MASVRFRLQAAAIERPARHSSHTHDELAPARGPGWFESSWELGRGLEVREGLPTNAGLGEWLAVCLAGLPTSPH